MPKQFLVANLEVIDCNEHFWYACSLLGNSIQQVVVNATTFTTCVDEATPRKKWNTAARELLDNAKGMAGGTEKEISLFIDGATLDMTLRPEIAPHLLSFAKLCCTVICNRVSPGITRDHMEN